MASVVKQVIQAAASPFSLMTESLRRTGEAVSDEMARPEREAAQKMRKDQEDLQNKQLEDINNKKKENESQAAMAADRRKKAADSKSGRDQTLVGVLGPYSSGSAPRKTLLGE